MSLLTINLLLNWTSIVTGTALAGPLTQAPPDEFLGRPDRFCPTVHVRCLGREISNVCGGVACAFPTEGGEFKKCTMILRKSACELFGLKDLESTSGAEFRKRTDCHRFSDQQFAKSMWTEAISTCATVRHEYIHLIDINAQSPRVGDCTERVAEEKELLLVNRLFKRLCSDPFGKRQTPPKSGEYHYEWCRYYCDTIARKAALLSWDTSMCRKTKETLYGGPPITEAGCRRAVRECKENGYWKNFLPKFCTDGHAAQPPELQHPWYCESQISSAHGCDYYGGPKLDK
jgi:hypothetical protein